MPFVDALTDAGQNCVGLMASGVGSANLVHSMLGTPPVHGVLMSSDWHVIPLMMGGMTSNPTSLFASPASSALGGSWLDWLSLSASLMMSLLHLSRFFWIFKWCFMLTLTSWNS
jgi:hypothetical protein